MAKKDKTASKVIVIDPEDNGITHFDSLEAARTEITNSPEAWHGCEIYEARYVGKVVARQDWGIEQ